MSKAKIIVAILIVLIIAAIAIVFLTGENISTKNSGPSFDQTITPADMTGTLNDTNVETQTIDLGEIVD
jgi:hypothetical protein